jgi:pre-rRNA-processing protein TSR1
VSPTCRKEKEKGEKRGNPSGLREPMADRYGPASHRPGALSQQNKSHKRAGGHRSKGAQRAGTKGRVESQRGGGNGQAPREGVRARAGNTTAARQHRHGAAKQHRQQKREQLLERRRSVGVAGAPPKLVVPVWCGELAPAEGGVDGDAVLADLVGGLASACGPAPARAAPVVGSERVVYSTAWKQYLSFVHSSSKADLMSVLDAVKLADVVVLVMPLAGDDGRVGGVSEGAGALLSMLKGQGMPSIIGTVVDTGVTLGNGQVSQAKARKAVLKEISQQFERSFPSGVHVKFQAATATAAAQRQREMETLLRVIVNCPVKEMVWRDCRPYICVDAVDAIQAPDATGESILRVTGFLRGSNLDANNLVHISNVGTFQVARVTESESPTAPAPAVALGTIGDAEELVLAVPDPEKQEPLEAEMDPDPFAADQPPITDQDLEAATQARIENAHAKLTKAVPEGTSTYQANWFVSSSEDEGEGGAAQEDDDDADPFAVSSSDDDAHVVSDDNMGGPGLEPEGPDSAEDQFIDPEDRIEEADDDFDFPDEVRYDEDALARVRFQKFRGLKSFKNSYWDPKESLPHEYARVIQFDSQNVESREVDELGNEVSTGRRRSAGAFAGINRAILEQQAAVQPTGPFGDSLVPESAVQKGSFVTLWLRCTDLAKAEAALNQLQVKGVCIASGLLPFENRVSVSVCTFFFASLLFVVFSLVLRVIPFWATG